MSIETIKTVPNKLIETGKKFIPNFLKNKFEERPSSTEDAWQKIQNRIDSAQQLNSIKGTQITELGGSQEELNKRTTPIDSKLQTLKSSFFEMLKEFPTKVHDGGIISQPENSQDPLKINQTTEEFVKEMDGKLNQPGAKTVLSLAEKFGMAPSGVSKLGDLFRKAKNIYERK